MDGSQPVRQRKRGPAQQKAVQHERVATFVAEHATDAVPIDLAEVFPAKEVLAIHPTSGDPILPQDIARRTRYIDAHHKPEPDAGSGRGGRRNKDGQINEYTRDFIFKTLHQLLLSGMPYDQIALKFNVSLRTVYRWIDQLKAKMADEAKNVDPMPVLGDALSTYKVIAQHGFQMLIGGKTAADKRAGAEIARGAMNDQMKVLQLAGFFDTPHMRKGANNGDDPRVQSANALMDMAKQFMGGSFAALPEPDDDMRPPRQWSVPAGAQIIDDVDVEDGEQ
jgi:hypothetical protein